MLLLPRQVKVLLRRSDDFEQSRILCGVAGYVTCPRAECAASRALPQPVSHWRALSRQMSDNVHFGFGNKPTMSR